MYVNQKDDWKPVPKHMRLDARISAGIHRKCDRLKLTGDDRTMYFNSWFEKYGEAKRRKLDFLYEEQDCKCCFCGIEVWRFHQEGQGFPNAHRATLEHIIPKAFGGTDRLTNLALSCSRCNQRRGVMDFNHFKNLMARGKIDFTTTLEKQRARRAAKKLAKIDKARPRIVALAYTMAVLWIWLERFGHPIVDILDAYVILDET